MEELSRYDAAKLKALRESEIEKAWVDDPWLREPKLNRKERRRLAKLERNNV